MIGSLIINRLRRDERGATLTEFGLVAPILMIMLMGIFDMAHSQYTAAQINGAMQKAGRDLTLESAGSQQSAIDQRVIDQVKTVVPNNATVTLEKLSHFDFSDVGEAEEFRDEAPLDGICNNGEVFEDSNGNGQWDANRGSDGVGGARDAVLYKATVEWPRLFPVAGLIGMSPNMKLSSSTVLRNQPYDQQDRSIAVGNCP